MIAVCGIIVFSFFIQDSFFGRPSMSLKNQTFEIGFQYLTLRGARHLIVPFSIVVINCGTVVVLGPLCLKVVFVLPLRLSNPSLSAPTALGVSVHACAPHSMAVFNNLASPVTITLSFPPYRHSYVPFYSIVPQPLRNALPIFFEKSTRGCMDSSIVCDR